MRIWLLVASALATAAPGCSSGDCTAMGCLDGAFVRVSDLPGRGDLTMRVCVDGRCATSRHLRGEATEGVLGSEMRVPAAGVEVDVRVTIRTRSRRVLASGATRATVENVYPNGESCGVGCRQIELRVTDGRVLAR